MENLQEYCYILDYSDGTICEIKIESEDLDENCEIDIDKLFYKHNIDKDACSWMFTTSKIDTIIELN